MKFSQKSLIGVILLLCLFESSLCTRCKFPPPSVNFTEQRYSGVWYEIARYQTAGGGYFQKDCVCTQLEIFSNQTGYFSDNRCNKLTPQGKIISAVGQLNPTDTNGRFQQQFVSYGPKVDYTIFQLGNFTNSTGQIETFSVEYDCGDNISGYNYCVHFLSKEPTMSIELLDYLISQVNAQQLNTLNLPLKFTQQNGCYQDNTEKENFQEQKSFLPEFQQVTIEQ